MADIAQQIADLEQARDALPSDSPARTTLEAMIAQLRTAAPPPPQPERSGGINLGSAQVERIDTIVGQDDVAGDKVLGDKHEHHYGSTDRPDPDTLLREYLGALGGACNR